MKIVILLCLLAAPVPGVALAQSPDTIPASAVADSTARADSLQLMKELEAMSAEAASKPTTSRGGASGPSNPRMLPDVSAVGDLVADLSPDGSTLDDGRRLAVREIEVAIQAVVDPYFRGDVFLGFSDAEGVAIEQAFLTTTTLPYSLEARLGRFILPFGKQNQSHQHDLHTVEYPYVVQRFLGAEGLTGTGVLVSKIFAPFGFYQEIQVGVVDHLGDQADSLATESPANRRLGGLGYLAHLRNYWDLDENTNVEVAGSWMTGRRPEPVTSAGDFNAINVRQNTIGADVTFRWRPLGQGLYKSLILQAEVMRQLNDGDPILPVWASNFNGPDRDYSGGYVFGRYQLSQRVFLGSRYDWLQDPELAGQTLQAASAYLEFFPSEFSKLMTGYEHRFSEADIPSPDRILLQATFAVGPHKPHPF